MRERLTLLQQKKDDPTDQVFVFFPEELKVGVKSLKEYSERMETQKINKAILIVRNNLSPFARQALAEMSPLSFDVFLELELMVNITEHRLVPPHIRLSEAEKTQLLKR